MERNSINFNNMWNREQTEEFYRNLNVKHFETPDNVPEIPYVEPDVYKEVVIPNLIRLGAIPKSKLKVGKTYLGACRNAEKAVWRGKFFVYKRYKFGMWYEEEINHFEDDDGYDLFVPIKQLK